MDPSILSKVISFCINIPNEGSSTWKDSFGNYQISIGVDNLNSIFNNYKFRRLFFSNFIDEISNNFQYNSKISNIVISVGAFKAHNDAKYFSNKYGLQYITVPIPLSNDSFGTNRISRENEQSLGGPFPIKTVFDLHLINKYQNKCNFLGIGEFFGLYSSVIDYYLVREKRPPFELLIFVCDLINNLMKSLNENKATFSILLIKALLFKVLIMRTNIDYQIGCGADHLIAGYFEKIFIMPHGKAVYLALLLLLLLFPDWQKYGLYFSDIERFGIDSKLISLHELNKVTSIKIKDLFIKSQQIRPNRLSKIDPSILNRNHIKSMQDNVNNFRKLKKWDI